MRIAFTVAMLLMAHPAAAQVARPSAPLASSEAPQASAPPGQASQSAASAKGVRFRATGGLMVGDFEFGESFSGFQVTGGGFGRTFQNPRFEAVGDVSLGRGAVASVEVNGVNVAASSVTFIEGTGSFIYNFTSDTRSFVPFVGGGLTFGRYSISTDVSIISTSISVKKTYASVIVTGGLEFPRQDGRAFRIEARIGQFFALMAGMSF